MILAIHLSAPAPIISIWLRRSHIVPEQISYCAWKNFRDFENTSKSSLYFWKVDSHGAIILRQIKKELATISIIWFLKCGFCIFGCESTRGYLTPSFKFTIMTVIAKSTKLTTLLKMFTVMMRHNNIQMSYIRGVFQKFMPNFHRETYNTPRVMNFCAHKIAKYKSKQSILTSILVAMDTSSPEMRGRFLNPFFSEHFHLKRPYSLDPNIKYIFMNPTLNNDSQ